MSLFQAPVPFNVSPWETDPERRCLYALVTRENGQGSPERIEVSYEEIKRAEREPELLSRLAMARVRDAVARLCGYKNHAAMVREKKRQATNPPSTETKGQSC